MNKLNLIWIIPTVLLVAMIMRYMISYVIDRMNSNRGNVMRNYNKCYINYLKEERQCGMCKKIKPFSDFKTNDFGGPITYCSKCVNIRESIRQIKKRQRLNPERYITCDSVGCGHTYYREIKSCKKCGKPNPLKLKM